MSCSPCATAPSTGCTRFIARMPKLELHAHLTGSIPGHIIRRLIYQTYPPDEAEEQVRLCRLVAGDVAAAAAAETCSPADAGCVPADTAAAAPTAAAAAPGQRSMAECFALFKVLHRVVHSADILFQVALDVLEEFVFGSQVSYLELRSTPRPFSDPNAGVPSKRAYVELVTGAIDLFCRAVDEYNALDAAGAPLSSVSTEKTGLYPPARPASAAALAADLRARHGPGAAKHFVSAALLLSLDRSQPIEEAEDTVDLTIALRNEAAESSASSQSFCAGSRVCGLDLSGNPFAKTVSAFIPPLTRARAAGVPVTLHFAETPSAEDNAAALAFAPDRLGHAAVLTEELFEAVRASGIPVEVCLTSNLLCRLHESLDTHPFSSFHAHGHVWVPCTDDMGVFGSTLNDEWGLLLPHPVFDLPAQQHNCGLMSPTPGSGGAEGDEAEAARMARRRTLLGVSQRAVEACFCSEDVKEKIRKGMQEFATEERIAVA